MAFVIFVQPHLVDVAAGKLSYYVVLSLVCYLAVELQN